MSKPQAQTANGTALSPAAREQVVDYVTRVGEVEAVEHLSLSRHALSRAMAGLPVRRATAEVIRLKLQADEE